jgi:hypothetical protein
MLSLAEVPSFMISDSTAAAIQVRQAFLSLATILGNALIFKEDIEPSEISVGITFDGGDIDYPSRYTMYMADTLDNGAGYSSSYSTREKFEELLLFVESHLIPTYQAHSEQCRTSCPKCLRNYSNRFDHAGLDWRLGLDLFDLLVDPSTSFTTSNSRWEDVIAGRMSELLHGLDRSEYQIVEEVYRDTNITLLQSVNVALYPLHPLIDPDSALANTIRRDFEAQRPGMRCVFYSPYELERRPIPEVAKVLSVIEDDR